MEFKHKPVLLEECIEALNIKPDGIYVDGTLGGAGHSEEILKKLSNIKFNNFKITISDIEIMNGRENSYVLYFKIKENRELKQLQEKVYNILPVEKYNPNKFKFHITIHVDKDYDKIIKIKNELEQSFIPFELTVSSIGLFEIYPAKLVEKINSD